MKKIILASKSPRRKELLEKVGLKFEIKVSDFDESSVSKLPPKELAEFLSKEKGKAVAKEFKNAVIISADTIVILDGEMIGKPTSEEDARKMLRKLSGRDHQVITGFTIIDSEFDVSITRSVESRVFFREISDDEIDAYVETGETLDKAGGYGIHEKAAVFLERVDGDYSNVVGLPILPVIEELKKFGVNIVDFWKNK